MARAQLETVVRHIRRLAAREGSIGAVWDLDDDDRRA
jgi:hypothetical protein